MTPSDDRRDLPPEQDAVRRLLAEVRHDEPVPPAVAARLDAVLEELTASRREARDTAPVVDLSRRRRRGVGVALAAAAAVVVAGVGLGQVIGPDGSTDTASSADGGAHGGADGGGAGGAMESEAQEEGDARVFGAEEASPPGDSRTGPAPSGPTTLSVSSDSLRRDLRAVLRSQAKGTAVQSEDSACALAEATSVGEGTQVPVTLDGRPALALYRVPRGARRQVDVYLCGTVVPARSVSLAVR